MNAKSWVIVGALAVLLLAATGGYIYEKVRDHTEPDDPDYVTVLVADYNALIGRVERAEELADSRLKRIEELGKIGGDLEGQLGDSRDEVARLIAERERQRRILEDLGIAIGAGRTASDNLEQSNSRASDAIQAGLDILERLESGDPDPEG